MKIEVSHEHILFIPTHVLQYHHDSHEAHQQVSQEVGKWHSLVLISCFFKASIQHFLISNLVSLLRRSSAGVIWMWSGSSPGHLPLSTTVASSHLMEWRSLQACSATEGAPGGLLERDTGEVSSSKACLESSPLHQMGRGHRGGQGQTPWRTATQALHIHMTPAEEHLKLEYRA